MKEIDIKELKLNPMTMIGDEWWLITAGNKARGFNTMTAAWGQLGALWDRPDGKPHDIIPAATVFVRPSRYTKEFLDREELFTLSVLGRERRKELAYIGTHSGRDEDKIKMTGLTPVFDYDTTYFSEAKLVLVCRKIYNAPLAPDGFLDKAIIEKNYKNGNFHEVYVGEILKILA